MEMSTFSDDLRRYLALLWHWTWLLVLATLLAGAAAFFVSRRMTPVYQASTTLLINEAPATKSADYSSILTSERLARTYSELLIKNPVLEAVIYRLGLNMTAAELREAMAVELVRDTQLIEVRVEHTDPLQAAEIANAIVTVFAEQNQELQASRYSSSKQNLQEQLARMDEQIASVTASLDDLGTGAEDEAERSRLETALTQYRQTYAYLLQSFEQVRVAEAGSTSNVVQAEPATPPDNPIRPRTLVNTVLAAMVGLMLAVGMIFLTEALNDTIRNPEEVTRLLGLPVLGLIAQHQAEEGRPVTMAQPRSPVSESFRSLRTNIQFASVGKPIQTLLVTSPSPAEGKSTIATNLGIVMAQSGRRVAVIDADLRRPQVHYKLGLPNRAGISSLFVQPNMVLNGSLQATPTSGLFAMTAGELPPNPAELLGSEKMSEIMKEVQHQVDLIVLDSPPVMAVTDAAVLAPRVDGVLLVIKPGVTKLAAMKQAVEQLQRVGARILGVVLNEVDIQHSRYKYYHYNDYYSDYYGDGQEKHSRATKSRKNGKRHAEPEADRSKN